MRLRDAAPVLLLLACGCVTLPPDLTHDERDAALARRVARIARRTEVRMGIAALHLESGRRLQWNGAEPFEAASVIKLALLVEAAARAKEGRLDLTDRWRLTARATAAGSGVLDEFEPGLTPTNRDLLRLMVAISDNTAANRFIDLFGAPAVNARMEALGLPGIRLLGRIPDRDPKETESERWKGLRLGFMTPHDTAELYRRAATGALLRGGADRVILEALKAQRNHDRLPRLLLESVENAWAGKTGTMRGVRNDSGLLTTRKGRFVLVLFADRIPQEKGAGPRVNEAMGEIAAAIVNAWSATLPDVQLPKEAPALPALAPALPRVEVSPVEAGAAGPYEARIFRETDRRFWELWKEAGGNPRDACLVPAPNSWWEGDDGGKIEPVSSLVLHHTSQETDDECVSLFLKPESLVSAHFLVGRDGRLWQFVSLEHRAWHAGVSLLHGRPALNRTSVGVEITGDGNRYPFTRAQVETVVRLTGVLTALFDLNAPWIAGHEHIAPGRKDDPGALFPWNEVVRRGLELADRLGSGTVRE